MSKFSLSFKPEHVLPKQLQSKDGRFYFIDPNFRTVLACLRVLSNPDAENEYKTDYLAIKFYQGTPPPDMIELFCTFVSTGDQDTEQEEPIMDYDLDAPAIYTSFQATVQDRPTAGRASLGGISGFAFRAYGEYRFRSAGKNQIDG